MTQPAVTAIDLEGLHYPAAIRPDTFDLLQVSWVQPEPRLHLLLFRSVIGSAVSQKECWPGKFASRHTAAVTFTAVLQHCLCRTVKIRQHKQILCMQYPVLRSVLHSYAQKRSQSIASSLPRHLQAPSDLAALAQQC